MSGNLVTLGAQPAHLAKSGGGLNLNAAARANLQASFAVLKIRGKAWRVRYRGEETLITASAGTGHDGRPLPEAPVQHINVIVVGVASAISKRWYAQGFSDGESKAPDCFSVNGVSPDPASALKQSAFCATCDKNIWGSATTDNGKKAKACRDGRRIAVVPAGDVDNEIFGGPMLLDIPPTSLANLEQYASFLVRKNADMSQVITQIGFDPVPTHQRLTFTSVGWVEDAHEYEAVVETAKSDLVGRMLDAMVEDVTSEPAAALAGAKPQHLLRASPLSVVRNDTPDEPDEPVEAPKPTPPPPPAPPVQEPPPPAAAKAASPFARRAAPVQVAPPGGVDAPVMQTAKKTVAPTVVQGAPASLEDEIDNLLAGN
jgi:hypothetical protein